MNNKRISNFFRLKTILLLTISSFIVFSSCVDNISNDKTSGVEPESSYFDFSTTQTIKVKLDFGYDGYISLIKFYDTYPYLVNEETGDLTLNPDLNPIYEIYTEKDNTFEGEIQLPAMTKEVYIATDQLILSDALALTIENGAINYDYKNREQPTKSVRSNKALKAISYNNDFITLDASQKLYGLYNTYAPWSTTYTTSHLASNSKLNIYSVLDNNAQITEESTIGEMMNRVRFSIMKNSNGTWVKKNNADKLRSSKVLNLKVLEEYEGKKSQGAEVDLTYLKSTGGYHNAICYYYYDSNLEPITAEALKSLPKYVLLPRTTRDGLAVPLTVRLQYFGLDGTTAATDTFPPNVTIGWMMVPNLGNNLNWYAGIDAVNNALSTNYKNGHQIYSNKIANTYGIGCMALYDALSKTMIIGFEDQSYRTTNHDKSYDDILFYVTASPIEAIESLSKAEERAETGQAGEDDDKEDIMPNTDDPDEDIWTTRTEKGLLAFEDVWPSGGDYDLNDVVVHYTTQIKFNQFNEIKEITHSFISLHNGAQFNNAFGFIINDGVGTGTIDETRSKYFTKEADNQFIIYENNKTVALDKGQSRENADTFKITRTFSESSYPSLKNYVSNNNPFIVPHYVKGVTNRTEVHLPKHSASSWANHKLLNSADDAYYINKNGKYPFAIQLVNVDNMSNYSENVSISKKYPRFDNWVTSIGNNDKDWYIIKSSDK